VVLAVLLGLLAGCGRVGYEPTITPRPETEAGDALHLPDRRDAGPDDTGALPGPGLDAAVAPVGDGSGPTDQRVADMASPADAAPSPADTASSPIDSASPADRPPDTADTASMPGACVPSAPADMIADFEAGDLKLNRVGGRGGMTFHVVNTTSGTAANVALIHCGQRAMLLQSTGGTTKAVLAQGQLVYSVDGVPDLYDARAYRGISVVLRASRAIDVRLKLPNGDTTAGGNDHFQLAFVAGTGWQQLSATWSAFHQLGTATQFPSLDVSTLYAVEISATLPAGVSLWVDEIAFTR
jgi:hypothetical protein